MRSTEAKSQANESGKYQIISTNVTPTHLNNVFFLQTGRILTIDCNGLLTVWDHEQNITLSHQAKVKPGDAFGSYPNYSMRFLDVACCLLPEGPVLSKCLDYIPSLTKEDEDTYRFLSKNNNLYQYTNHGSQCYVPISRRFYQLGQEYFINRESNLLFFSKVNLTFSDEATFPGFNQCCPISSNEIALARPSFIQFIKRKGKEKMCLHASLSCEVKQADFNPFNICHQLLIANDDSLLCIFTIQHKIIGICKIDLKTKRPIAEIRCDTPAGYPIFSRIFKSPDNRIYIIECAKEYTPTSLKKYLLLDPITLYVTHLELDSDMALMDIKENYQLIVAIGSTYKIIETPVLKQYLHYLERILPVQIGEQIKPVFRGATGLAELVARYITDDISCSRNLASFFQQPSLGKKNENNPLKVEKCAETTSSLCSIM